MPSIIVLSLGTTPLDMFLWFLCFIFICLSHTLWRGGFLTSSVSVGGYQPSGCWISYHVLCYHGQLQLVGICCISLAARNNISGFYLPGRRLTWKAVTKRSMSESLKSIFSTRALSAMLQQKGKGDPWLHERESTKLEQWSNVASVLSLEYYANFWCQYFRQGVEVLGEFNGGSQQWSRGWKANWKVWGIGSSAYSSYQRKVWEVLDHCAVQNVLWMENPSDRGVLFSLVDKAITRSSCWNLQLDKFNLKRRCTFLDRKVIILGYFLKGSERLIITWNL